MYLFTYSFPFRDYHFSIFPQRVSYEIHIMNSHGFNQQFDLMIRDFEKALLHDTNVNDQIKRVSDCREICFFC